MIKVWPCLKEKELSIITKANVCVVLQDIITICSRCSVTERRILVINVIHACSCIGYCSMYIIFEDLTAGLEAVGTAASK